MIVKSIAQGLLAIDCRTPEEYAMGHLEGALNMDISSANPQLNSEEELQAFEQALANLNGDLGTTPGQAVVVYDNGLTPRMAKTAFILALGGLNVSLCPSGWELETRTTTVPLPSKTTPWVQLNLGMVLRQHELAQHPNLIDVRTAAEYQAGYILQAQHLPLSSLMQGHTTLEGDHVGVYCKSGARSAVAFWLLKQQGKQVRNYLGSWQEWSRTH